MRCISKSVRDFTTHYKVEGDKTVFYLNARRDCRRMTCILLLLFKEVLLGAGSQVDTAETFRGADNLLVREYDLLLSDGQLPGGAGMMLADKAKAKCISALIVTAVSSSSPRPVPSST